MTTHEAQQLLEGLSPADLRRVATRFAYEMTILARSAHDASSEPAEALRFACACNEKLHRLLDAALEAEDGNAISAVSLLLGQVEFLPGTNQSHQTMLAFQRAIGSVVPHVSTP